MRIQKNKLAAIAGLGLALAPAAQAAVVTWESAVLITDVGAVGSVDGSDAVISTEGTLVTATEFVNKYQSAALKADKTVNGVLFTSNLGLSNPAGFTVFNKWAAQDAVPDPNNNMSDALTDLLRQHTYRDDDLSVDFSLNDLTVGESYLVQFVIRPNNAPNGLEWTQTLTSGTSSSDAMDLDFAYSLVGRFTADLVDQPIQIVSTATLGQRAPSIAAYQVREVAASSSDPEITSITSLGGGVFELKLEGENSTSYQFFSSTTLDFDTGTLVPLTAILGGGGGTDVTTTSSGDATVQMSPGGSANFVRAVGP
jgi:hypothetical protein